MHIIPVIDLLNGAVVHAKRGERQHYQPIKSLLTASSKPLDIVAALLDVYPFSQLYIADLNAIQQQGDNLHHIRAIEQQFPQLKLWIDAGVSNQNGCTTQHSNAVLGSESFSELRFFLALKNQLNDDFVLSLDFLPNGYQGPAELLQSSQYWPHNVIVMTLQNVGANQGVNTDLIQSITPLAKGKNVYAAGGVRDCDDLIALKKTGIHGALVATALHQKQLTYEQISSLYA